MLLVGMECFVKRHRQTLNELLGIDFGKSPSDSTFPLLLAQPGVAKELDRPNRLWCSALWPPADCVYIAQVSPTPRAWALRHLEAVELEGVLVQADALHGNRPLPLPRPTLRRLPDRRQTQAPQWISPDQRPAHLQPPAVLREDAQRYREFNGAQILATLRSMAINGLRLGGFWSITEGIAASLTTSKACLGYSGAVRRTAA
jgi:hypothetical protein